MTTQEIKEQELAIAKKQLEIDKAEVLTAAAQVPLINLRDEKTNLQRGLNVMKSQQKVDELTGEGE